MYWINYFTYVISVSISNPLLLCKIFSFECMIMIEKSFERQHNLAVAARVKMVLRLFNELKLYCPEG